MPRRHGQIFTECGSARWSHPPPLCPSLPRGWAYAAMREAGAADVESDLEAVELLNPG